MTKDIRQHKNELIAPRQDKGGPKAQDEIRMGLMPLDQTRMGLRPKTRQDKTRMGLTPRHNEGNTQNITQKRATRMANL